MFGNPLYWRDEGSEEIIMSARIVATMSVLLLSLASCGQSNSPAVSGIIPAGDGVRKLRYNARPFTRSEIN